MNSSHLIKYIVIVISIPVIQIFIIACENNIDNTQKGTTNHDKSTTAGADGVLLITGSNGEYTWNITEVEIVEGYFTPSMQKVDERAIKISGYVKGRCAGNCNFFDRDGSAFVLSDFEGNQYVMQAPLAEFYQQDGETLAKFSVFFSASENNNNINPNNDWGNFFIEDYLESNRDLPGHRIDLSPFNVVI